MTSIPDPNDTHRDAEPSEPDRSPVLDMLTRGYWSRLVNTPTVDLYRSLESLRFQRANSRELIERALEGVSYPHETLDYLEALIADTEAEIAKRERLMAGNADLRRYRVPRDRQRTSLPIDAKALRKIWPIREFAEVVMGVTLTNGNPAMGQCPLPDHNDRSPSFAVYPDTESWYCYGCKKGGDLFHLTAFFFGLDVVHDFPDIVRRVADATPGLKGEPDPAPPEYRTSTNDSSRSRSLGGSGRRNHYRGVQIIDGKVVKR